MSRDAGFTTADGLRVSVELRGDGVHLSWHGIRRGVSERHEIILKGPEGPAVLDSLDHRVRAFAVTAIVETAPKSQKSEDDLTHARWSLRDAVTRAHDLLPHEEVEEIVRMALVEYVLRQ